MRRIKRSLRKFWRKLSFAPEVEWYLFRQRSFKKQGRLRKLQRGLRDWEKQAASLNAYVLATLPNRPHKKMLFFAMIYTWVRYSSFLAMTYAALGNDVTLAFLPYEDWFTDDSDYDLRKRNLQLRSALAGAEPQVRLSPWFDLLPSEELPPGLADEIEDLSVRDYQYTRQVEDVDEKDSFLSLRRERNTFAARIAYAWMLENRPEVVVVPNGLILEFGAVFAVARYLDIPVVTYEFGEQHDRIWLAQNKPVMYQDTAAMWAVYQNKPFSAEMRARIEELYASRRQAGLWQNFSRQWQDIPTEGAQAVRAKLGLDERPVVLLAANVIGDSLTLGRQVFSESMTEWISRTLDYFREKDQVQFVLRIHPGERYTDGPSVENIIRQRLPEAPAHFRIISAQDPVNTYDLMAVASLGMTYTTTVGMEMGMYGVPVIVVGKTHYRGKGFTIDPKSWPEYFAKLDAALADFDSVKLSPEQVERAWHYAYRFFFDYPQPFPWHLRRFWKDAKERPLESVLTHEGWQQYGKVFAMLAADLPDWKNYPAAPVKE